MKLQRNLWWVCVILFSFYLMQTVVGKNLAGDGDNDATLNIGLLLPYSEGWTVGQKIGAAVIVAIEKVHEEGLLQGYNLSYDWVDTKCEAYEGLTEAMHMWSDAADLDVFIGGGCSAVCEPVALVAAVWNMPHISWGCNSADLSDKHKYPSFSRTVGSWVSLAPVMADLLAIFSWNRAGILATDENIMQLTANAFRDEIQKRGKQVFRQDIRHVMVDHRVDLDRLDKMRNAIRFLKDKTRGNF